MTAFVKRHLSVWDLGILLTCVLFVLNKIPVLGLPYFWDEAWVYAPAVFDMFENGPSLSPDSIDPRLSRGHPVLFHFLAVCWMMVFGSSITATHSFAVFMATLTIIAVYKLGEELGTKGTGFGAALLFAVQPMFVAQSGFLLPEVTLTLFVVLTILFYLKRSVASYVMAGTAMLLTKETGILVIGVLCLLELYEFIRERNFKQRRILEFLAVGGPVLLAFLYFLVQYFQFGWFMFPDHVGMFDTDPETWSKKRSVVFRVLFFEQNRNLIIGFALASGALAWQRALPALRVLLLMCGLTFLTLNSLESWLPDWYFFYVFPIVVAASLVLVGREMFGKNSRKHLFVPLVGILTLVMTLFTSAHVVIHRYLLFVTPMLILASVLVVQLSLKRSKWLFAVSMVFLIAIQYHYVNRIDTKRTHIGNMRYVDEIYLIQQGIKYLKENTDFTNNCYSGSFLIREALAYPVQGYVSEDYKPDCIPHNVAPEVDYILLVSFESHPHFGWVKVDKNFKVVFSETRGAHTAWVFKRIGV